MWGESKRVVSYILSYSYHAHFQYKEKNCAHGLPNVTAKTMLTYEDWKIVMSQTVSFRSRGKTHSRKPFRFIHADVCGALPAKSNAGFDIF